MADLRGHPRPSHVKIHFRHHSKISWINEKSFFRFWSYYNEITVVQQVIGVRDTRNVRAVGPKPQIDLTCKKIEKNQQKMAKFGQNFDVLGVKNSWVWIGGIGIGGGETGPRLRGLLFLGSWWGRILAPIAPILKNKSFLRSSRWALNAHWVEIDPPVGGVKDPNHRRHTLQKASKLC